MFRVKRILITANVVFLLSLQSCDPARVLVVKAAGVQDSSVTIYANKNILPSASGNGDEKIILHIPAAKDTIFYYGIGGWGEDDLMSGFAANFDSIILQGHGERQVLSNLESITDYLLNHRSGFASRILTIEAE